MATNYLVKEKFVNAFRMSAELRDELKRVLEEAEVAEDRMAMRICPDYYHVGANMSCLFFWGDPERQLVSCARQCIGIIAKAQRESGYKIVSRYVNGDEEKVALLHEIEDFLNAASATADSYTKPDGEV